MEPKETINLPGNRSMKMATEQVAEQDREEPTEAPADEDTHNGQTSKAEEDAADEALAANYPGQVLMQVEDGSMQSADEAEDIEPTPKSTQKGKEKGGNGKKGKGKSGAESAVEDEEAAAPHKDMEAAPKPIQQGKEKGAKGKRGTDKPRAELAAPAPLKDTEPTPK